MKKKDQKTKKKEVILNVWAATLSCFTATLEFINDDVIMGVVFLCIGLVYFYSVFVYLNKHKKSKNKK